MSGPLDKKMNKELNINYGFLLGFMSIIIFLLIIIGIQTVSIYSFIVGGA